MQKHRRWLIITIWISTIAFIGAGAVSWGNLSYGSKATSVAQVGDISISVSELQKQYSQIYAQYQKMLGDKFDEKMAKQLGIEARAMQILMQRALLLNLAQAYELIATDEEVNLAVRQMPYFQKDGHFDKPTYKRLLKQNHYSMKEFEAGLKKDLTIEKISKLLASKVYAQETDPFKTMLSIADKIEYRLLNADSIKVDLNDEALKAYWEFHKNSYMTQTEFVVQSLVTEPVDMKFDEKKIESFYRQNSFKFTDNNGSILTLKEAKNQVIEALRDKYTRLKNRKLLNKWKEGTLDKNITIKTETFTKEAAPFEPELIKKLSALKVGGYLKSIKVGKNFVAFKLSARHDARVKSFKEAKLELIPDYIKEQKSILLSQKAQALLKNFKGKTTGFVTINDALAFASDLNMQETHKALKQIFQASSARGIAPLSKEQVLLFHIKEQKLLFKENAFSNDIALEKNILKLKEQARLQALITKLSQTYKSEKYR